MHILIPMSGRGSRFAAKGYPKPKPLIEFYGKTMIENVLTNLGTQNSFTLCVLREHYESDTRLFGKLHSIVSDLHIILIDEVTRGAAETCLMAKSYIEPDQPLMIANCDQMMEWDQDHFEHWMETEKLDGCMFTFFKNDPAYSYVKVNGNGIAVETAEKKVISPHATTGIYVWTKGQDFVDAAEKMIEKNITVNNEFYVCPVYNQNIANGARIGIYQPEEHWPIGTPEDLEEYLDWCYVRTAV